MSRTTVSLCLLLSFPAACLAQISGNAAYTDSGAKARAEQAVRNNHVLSEHELPPTGTSMFVEANVLANVRADEYVAVFAVAQEGASVAEVAKKMEDVLNSFVEDVKALGIDEADLYVDFVAQNKIYGFEITDDLAREKLTGFELKKNVLIRFQDQKLLDSLLAAAAESQIYDLIEVEYVVKDAAKVQDQLMEEAARVIQKKTKRYEQLLGTKVLPHPQIYAERNSVHFPSELYDSYVAQESEYVEAAFRRDGLNVQGARKSRTFYYNGLDGDGFDSVIDPAVIEPQVQFTLHLKLRYEIEQARASP
ncbi:MAG TPA: SIMPL domain-containing protein [Pirellulaceae bacterium]|nr:SIMPL domain-containing protein [Pirellulaceae bacterium]